MFSQTNTMKVYVGCLVLLCVSTSFSSAIPKPDEHKDRVLNKDLSDVEHNPDDEHNPDYDHEAFLGKEEAKSFDELTPEESKMRLGKIVEKIDKDNDGLVTEDELKVWIKYVQNRYIQNDADKQWKELQSELADNKLVWEAYKKRTYGFLDDQDMNAEEDSESYNYKDMIKRDERRFERADKNGDGALDQEEFADFLHPEEAPHMRDIVVEETIEDIDKDKDGKISLAEYIGDMHPSKEGTEEPDWVESEREAFKEDHDKNKDGLLDFEEVKNWIMPDDYDHIMGEVTHLIDSADKDGDGKLTKEEILDKYDVFVGSQATDFGEALTRHDEF
ncbi:unnamed protein product [Owenia fusiformis]|uniref:Reticulocalbin-3 n=1 Tax=Owenia fusiformis TaxID=6347 RepID=A0A8S4NWK0_OWEFU|nr:unnamed protein product [Owenia fusiformis]